MPVAAAVRPQKTDQTVIAKGEDILRPDFVRGKATNEAEQRVAEEETAEHNAQLRRIEMQVLGDQRRSNGQCGAIEIADAAAHEQSEHDEPAQACEHGDPQHAPALCPVASLICRSLGGEPARRQATKPSLGHQAAAVRPPVSRIRIC